MKNSSLPYFSGLDEFFDIAWSIDWKGSWTRFPNKCQSHLWNDIFEVFLQTSIVHIFASSFLRLLPRETGYGSGSASQAKCSEEKCKDSVLA